MGEALCAAYREYLERMLQDSASLVDVDYTSVPEDTEITPVMLEWADFV